MVARIPEVEARAVERTAEVGPIKAAERDKGGGKGSDKGGGRGGDKGGGKGSDKGGGKGGGKGDGGKGGRR
jgi:hypothetical protein